MYMVVNTHVVVNTHMVTGNSDGVLVSSGGPHQRRGSKSAKGVQVHDGILASEGSSSLKWKPSLLVAIAVMSLKRGRAAQRRSMSARFKITFHFRARPRAAST